MSAEEITISGEERGGTARKIRLVALDLDRTTLRDDKSLSPGNREAIMACLEAGIHVVVASGRSYGSLPVEVMQIPGLRYAITGNGAAIYTLNEPEGGRQGRRQGTDPWRQGTDLCLLKRRQRSVPCLPRISQKKDGSVGAVRFLIYFFIIFFFKPDHLE